MGKITLKIPGLEVKQGQGRRWCSLNLTQRSENWKGALGEMVANTLGKGIATEAVGAPESSGEGGTSVHRVFTGKQWGKIN